LVSFGRDEDVFRLQIFLDKKKLVHQRKWHRALCHGIENSPELHDRGGGTLAAKLARILLSKIARVLRSLAMIFSILLDFNATLGSSGDS
jgi:hypothetical protein